MKVPPFKTLFLQFTSSLLSEAFNVALLFVFFILFFILLLFSRFLSHIRGYYQCPINSPSLSLFFNFSILLADNGTQPLQFTANSLTDYSSLISSIWPSHLISFALLLPAFILCLSLFALVAFISTYSWITLSLISFSLLISY